jgi:hypothetical protein
MLSSNNDAGNETMLAEAAERLRAELAILVTAGPVPWRIASGAESNCSCPVRGRFGLAIADRWKPEFSARFLARTWHRYSSLLPAASI